MKKRPSPSVFLLSPACRALLAELANLRGWSTAREIDDLVRGRAARELGSERVRHVVARAPAVLVRNVVSS